MECGGRASDDTAFDLTEPLGNPVVNRIQRFYCPPLWAKVRSEPREHTVADPVAIPPGIDQPDFYQPRQFLLNSAQRQARPTRDFPKMQLAALHAEEQPENFRFPFGRYDINQRHHNVRNKHTIVWLLQSMSASFGFSR
jgi:hypothetical protein